MSAELEKVRLERDLCRLLLELGTQTGLERFLKEALAPVVEVAGAQQGYLELHGTSDDVEHGRSIAHGFSSLELEAVRSKISEAIAPPQASTQNDYPGTRPPRPSCAGVAHFPAGFDTSYISEVTKLAYPTHPLSASSSALASFRSAVSKPSVNQS